MKLKATLNTGSQNGDALISEALAWVSIIPTDLRAVIDGGSARTLGSQFYFRYIFLLLCDVYFLNGAYHIVPIETQIHETTNNFGSLS